MVGIPFKISGTMYSSAGRAAFLLSQEGRQYTLRLGYVLRGTGETLLPETLLDDWGHEVAGAELYHWVGQNAAQFPRAELFGLDIGGRPWQCFLREVDLTASYPCFVFEDPSKAALTSSVQITDILVPATGVGHQTQQPPPGNIPFPLRRADATWWLVDRFSIGRPGFDFFSSLETDESG